MKIKDGYLVRDVAGQTVVMPFGEQVNLNILISLNDTGKFLWQLLEQERTLDELVTVVLAEYDVDEETARSGVIAFVEKLNENGFLA